MLYIHTSNHLEQLKNQFSDLLKTPLNDVLKTETVIVQNAGMARWLSIEMAKTSGISANTEYLFPAEYMWRLLRLVSPDIPEYSQCAPDTLRFHIFTELLSHAEDYPELHHYILKRNEPNLPNVTSDQLDELSTWELACQTARLLDQYLFYRGEWIDKWEQQDTSLITDKIEQWQSRLWNRCVKENGLLHWLLLQKQFAENIEAIDSSVLEERVSFFSMSALSPGYIDLLAGVAQKTDIHIFIINPCADVYWGDIQSPKSFSKLETTELEYNEIGNPLLASLGKQGRDFIDKLISIQDQGLSEEHNDTSHYNTIAEHSLLKQIQNDIYTLEQPTAIGNFDQNDSSIQIHSCHTAMREVEVLHDQILAHLDADADLTPSDIVVMMPDIEKYAPYIESIFSSSLSEQNKQTLPFSIADRDAQNIFKTVQALNKLWALPDTRFDVEAVLELLEYDDIRQHFGLDQEQSDYCRELALATNIRWGISAKARQQDNLPNTEEHTWKYALDRMLLGYTLAANDDTETLFDSKRRLKLLPYNEIEGSNALVLAKFKKFTDTVFAINEWQNKTLSLEAWQQKAITLIKQLCPENIDQQRIFKSLADIQIKADLADFERPLAFTVYQKILQQSLSEMSASEKFLGYGITFCALVPMRSVPFKLVVLMGMNDGEFPRQDTRPSFDLMTKQSHRGDRSRRDEDRYLFLESILAARQKLMISFIGQSIKDNTELAPSILVNELLDTIKINTGLDAEHWITQHPLQSFSSRYFQADSTQKQPLFSYAAHYINANNTPDKPFNNDTPFITQPLSPLSDDFKKVSLNDLITFYKNPSRAFLKTRFQIDSYDNDNELNTREPFALEAFKERDIRQLILKDFDRLADENINPEDEIKLNARAKGLLPYGQIGDTLYAKEKHTAEAFAQQLPDINSRPNSVIAFNINGFELLANIDQLSDNGRYIAQVGRPFAGDYIDLWLHHLCLNAHITQTAISPLQPFSQFYSPDVSFQLSAIPDAEQQLAKLLEYYWKGLHFPLAFFPKSAFAMYRKTGKPNLSELNTKWNGNDRYAGEKESFEHALLHRNIVLNQEQQGDEFLEISDLVFGKLFAAMTDL